MKQSFEISLEDSIVFMELSSIFFAIVDKKAKFKYVNDYVVKRLGYSYEELYSKPLTEFLTPESKEKSLSFTDLIFSGAALGNFEEEFLSSRGELINISWSLKYSSDKGLIYAVGKDISSYKQYEEELSTQNKKLEYLNDDLKEFISIVSHDLKAPLRGISTMAEWLSRDYKGKLDKDFDDNIDLIVTRAKHASNIISSLTHYSKSINKADEVSEVNLGELIVEILTSLDYPKSYQIQINGTLPNIKISRTQIYHIFQNLISNAIKYVARDDARITIEHRDLGDSIQFTVADNGPGIDPDDHERIFKIFQTVNQDREEASGVGLSIVKKIIEKLNGRLWLESQLGEGSKFHFTLAKL